MLQRLRYLFLHSACVFALMLPTGCHQCDKILISEDIDNDNVESSYVYDVQWVHEDWWEIFKDEQLTAFILQSLAEHPSLKIAQARIELARYNAMGIKSALYPTANLTADSIKTIQSKTGIFAPPPKAVPGTICAQCPQESLPINYTQSELLLDIEYEIDLWGKNLNAWRASLNDLQASKAEEAITRLSLSLLVADAYFRIQSDMIRKKIAEDILESRKQVVELAGQELLHGLATNLTANLVAGNSAVAAELLLEVENDLDVSKNQLRALIAEKSDYEVNVEGFPLERWNYVSNLMPKDIPMDVLANRADLMAYLQRVLATGYRIKVAEALFYPNVNLMALTGLQTIKFSKLLDGKSLYGMWGPAIHLPIFTGWALEANLGVQQMNYAIAVEQYNDAVLSAVEQVLDNVMTLRNIIRRLGDIKALTKANENVYRLTLQRMNSNLSTRTDVLDAKIQWLQSLDTEVQVETLGIQTILNLIRSLGGGYGNI